MSSVSRKPRTFKPASEPARGVCRWSLRPILPSAGNINGYPGLLTITTDKRPDVQYLVQALADSVADSVVIRGFSMSKPCIKVHHLDAGNFLLCDCEDATFRPERLVLPAGFFLLPWLLFFWFLFQYKPIQRPEVDWVAYGAFGQWAAAITTVDVILLALWQSNLRNFFLGPVLTISLGETPPHRQGQDERFFNLVITNRKECDIARGCRVFVVRSRESSVPLSNFVSQPLSESKQLPWAFVNKESSYAAQDLLPGVPYAVRMVREKNDVSAVIDWPGAPDLPQFCCLMYTVMVVSENGGPVSIHLLLNYQAATGGIAQTAQTELKEVRS